MRGLASLLAIHLATAPALAGPDDAVVRIPSHGISGTVIATGPGRSLILTCAHGHEGADRTRPMTFDIPTPAGAPAPKRAASRVLALDHAADLVLIELDDGPLPYVCPVAPAGYRPGPHVLSVGYDEMKTPPQKRPCTQLRDDGRGMWWTRERPWHGRSGGGLIDLDLGRTVGVCHGYTGPKNHAEVFGGANGLYVSHAAILAFLAQRPAGGPVPRAPLPPPAVREYLGPQRPLCPS